MKRSLLFIMKKWLGPAAFGTVFALSAVLTGCTQNPPENPVEKKITIHASVESTRTSLGDDLSVMWSEGDAFYLFSDVDSSGELFSMTSGAGTNDASFEGYKPAGNAFVAAYPAEGVLAFDGLNVHMTFPVTQTYVKGSFAESANPMIATANGDVSEMFFRNVCGLLELQITGTGTLSRISLSSGSPMAGSAGVDSGDLSVSWNDGYGQSLEIDGINEALSTSAPLSVYCALPAGEYESLVVRMTDNEGNVVTKEAMQSVTVERAKVTPVSGLVFENAKAPAVSISIDETESNFKKTVVTYALTGSADADGIMYGAVPKSGLDEYMLQNPQNTLLDWLLANGSAAPSVPYTVDYQTSPEQKIVFLAAALSGQNVVGDVLRTDYTVPAIKKDPALTLTAERVAFTCTETAIDVTVLLPEGAKRLHHLLFLSSVVEGVDDEVLYDNVLVYKDCGVDVEGETYTTGATGLTPGTAFVWLFVVEGENGFGELYKAEISTEAHVASAASIEISPKNISDVTAEFDIVLNDAATYKLVAVRRVALGVDLSDENALAAYIDAAEGYDFSAGETSVSLPVIPSTPYVVLGLAYDAEGVYGRPIYYEFTTDDPIPGTDTPEYRQFIGQWTVSYTDLFGTPLVAMNVTVTEDVVGKTYKVSGMMDPFASMQYSVEDEIRARFEDGKIVFDGMTLVNNSGTLAGNYNVYLYLAQVVGDQIYLDVVNRLYGEKSGNNIVFSGSSPDCVGYLFYAQPLSSDVEGGLIGSAYSDVIWSPVMASASTGNTENFGSNPPVNPGWN